MRDPSEESALLEGLGIFLASAEALVTFICQSVVLQWQSLRCASAVTRYRYTVFPFRSKSSLIWICFRWQEDCGATDWNCAP